LCAALLHRNYPRLTQPPLKEQADELLGAVAERLLKALREARPRTVRHLFTLADQHMRWELNDLARRLDEQPDAANLREGLVPSPPNSAPGSARKAAGSSRRSTSCRRTSGRSST
jgi:RNA polymerase sigma-70 factor (ECF subfamily)